MLGAGMIIIQPSTGKVVVLSERQEHEDGRALRSWFLPRGRKDVGESLEQAALREAYEESGLHTSFLPIILQHSAPGTPGTLADLDHARLVPCTEPIYTCMQVYEKTGHAKGKGEYLTFWYVGQVPKNSVVESGTRMADEVNYETHFLSIEDALSVLCGEQRHIMSMGYQLWRETVEMQSQSAYKEYIAHLHAMAHAGDATDLNAYSTGGGAWINSSHWEGFTSATKVAQDAEP